MSQGAVVSMPRLCPKCSGNVSIAMIGATHYCTCKKCFDGPDGTFPCGASRWGPDEAIDDWNSLVDDLEAAGAADGG